MTDELHFMFNTPLGDVLLTHNQLKAVLDILGGCETVERAWLGSGKGDNASGYMMQVRPVNLDKVQVPCMIPEKINTLRLATKLYDASKESE
jgi:hypothetical protein